MQQEAMTTKSGLVLLYPSSACNPAASNRLSLLSLLPGMKHLLTVALILIGIVSAPVNCALADGPHSIFVDPVSQRKTLLHLHHLDHALGSVQPVVSEEGRPGAAELPESMTVLIALSAVVPMHPTAEFREAIEAASPKPATPADRHYSPDIPPPRL